MRKHLRYSVVLLLLLPMHLSATTRYYVDTNRPDDSGDGTSWSTAKKYLQSALYLNPGFGVVDIEIWVAAGTYYPYYDLGDYGDYHGYRNESFRITSGVAIYGGFTGAEDEVALTQRDWVNNITILSGDIDDNDDTGDFSGNSYHVVFFDNADATTILDGFTITAGNANGVFGLGDMGVDNGRVSGGGIYNEEGSPQIINCIITDNRAGGQGGGLDGGGGIFNFAGHRTSANPTFTNCIISNNVSGGYGGGISNIATIGSIANPTFTNCVISGNRAFDEGGGIYNLGSHGTASPVFTNCTITGNITDSGDGGGMYNASDGGDMSVAIPNFINSIIWRNGSGVLSELSTPIYSYSDIEGSGGSGSWDASVGTDGGNNIDQNPLFVLSINPENSPSDIGDFHLSERSPAIDVGDNSIIHAITDLEGEDRIQGDRPDMGAYETTNQVDVEPPLMVSICPDMINCPNPISDYHVSSNLQLTLDQEVFQGTGTIEILQGVSVFKSILLPVVHPAADVVINTVTVEGDQHSVITIDLGKDMLSNTQYSVNIPATAFLDAAGNAFSGIPYTDNEGIQTSWNFLIDTDPPTVSFIPAPGSSGNAVDTDITLTFSETVKKPDGSVLTDLNVDGLITLKSDNSLGSDIAFSATIESPVITVSTLVNFESEQTVYVALATVHDDAGNPVSGSPPSATFTIADVISPTVTFVPPDGATSVAQNAVITLFLSETVLNGGGTEITNSNVAQLLTLKTDNSSGADIAFTATINGAKTNITVTPSVNFGSDQVVYVALDATVQDNTGNPVSGTLNATFTTINAQAPTVNIVQSPSVVSPTSISPIPVMVEFSEIVSGFLLADISVINGSAGNFAEPTAGRVFTTEITPSGSQVTVSVSGGVATGQHDRPNAMSNTLTLLFDQSAPTVEYSGHSAMAGIYNPLDGAIDVSLDLSSITLTFSKRVKMSGALGPEVITGDNLSDVITLRKATTADQADFDGGGGVAVNYTASVDMVALETGGFGHAITLNLGGEALDTKSTYYIAVNAGKIIDFDDVSLVHSVSSATFSTVDNGGPNIISFVYDDKVGPTISHRPGQFLTGVPTASDLIMVFDEIVLVNAGNLTLIKDLGLGVVQQIINIPLPNAMVRGNRTSEITIDLDNPLEGQVEYYITVDAGSFKDESDNMFDAIDDPTSWNFRTRDNTPPTLVDHSPDPGKNEIFEIDGSDPIELIFNEPVIVGDGSIEIYDSQYNLIENINITDGSKIEILDVTPDEVRVSPENLTSDSQYHLLIKKAPGAVGALVDLSSPPNPLVDIDNRSLIIIQTSDMQPPHVLNYSLTEKNALVPSLFIAEWQDAVFEINQNVDINSHIEISFDEDLFKIGGILPTNENIDEVLAFKIFDVQGNDVQFESTVSNNKRVISLAPHNPLNANTTYFVQIKANYLEDMYGNVLNEDRWASFTTADIDTTQQNIEPPPITLVPANGATGVDEDAYIRIIFSVRVYSETGEKFEAFDVSDGMVVVREDNASGLILNATAQISPDTTAITLQTIDMLKSEQTYYVQVNPRFADVNGTVVEKTIASFTTADVIPPEITLSPEEGAEDVALETELNISFSEPVRLTDNSVITTENVKDLLYVNLWNLEGEAIEFTVSINAARDEITLTPSEALPSYEKIVFGLNDGLEDYSENPAGSAVGYFFTTGIPGFDIDPLSGINTTETGLSDTFEVALTSEPDFPVEVRLMSTDITEGLPYPTQLIFTRDNWEQKQSVKVTGVDDPDGDGDMTYYTKLFNITSDDPGYDSIEPDSTMHININDDPPGVQVYPMNRFITSEEGKQAQFGVVLLSRPTATVTIPVSSSDVSEGSVDVTQLIFEPEEWDQTQYVTLTGLDDDEDDDDVEYKIIQGQCNSADPDYSAIDPSDVLAINIDDDVAGFTLDYGQRVSTTEMGTDTVFTVVLNAEPTGTVALSVSTSDPTEGLISHNYLTFSPSNWNIPQEVTVTGVNDNLGDGDVYYNIMVGEAIISGSDAYSRLAAKEVKVVNLDREPQIITGSEFMNFDSSGIGIPDSASVYVLNVGSDTLFIAGASVNDSAFSAMFAPSPITSGDSSLVRVFFNPEEAGKKQSVLYVEHNDPYQFPKELLISASVRDKSGPSIIELESTPTTAAVGEGVEVTVQVLDVTGVFGIGLYYGNGIGDFDFSIMTEDSSGSYSGSIPTGTANLTGLVYFIVATDTKGNITYSDTVSVPVQFGDKQLSTDVPGSAYPSGISKDAWRLISVPNMIDENKATQIFGNELKDRNERSWRLVSDFVSKEKWKDVKEITPGMGMWLYQQVKDNVFISTGAGITSDLSRHELTVRSGWSIIGSPYAFTFTADIDGETFSGPFAYALDGVEGWSDVVTRFQPWAGYIIKNLTSQDQVLTLRPFASAGTDSSLKRELAGEDIGWDVNLSAVSGKYGDLYNRLGRAPGAWEGIGPFDHAEPPIILRGISLAFRQDNGKPKKLMYARDMRSVSEHNGTWPMDLMIKGIKDPISFTAELDEHYPLDLGLVILDHQTREVTDLKEDPDLKINHGNEDVPYRFTVVSGDGDYIIRKVEEILAGIPERFSLGQNYPNPFNSTTTIRYALPLPEFVNISIYNILGQEVHKMVGSWQEAGFHTARWDGRDLKGIPVSSGVYIYHIQAGKFMAARKMAIIK